MQISADFLPARELRDDYRQAKRNLKLGEHLKTAVGNLNASVVAVRAVAEEHINGSVSFETLDEVAMVLNG